MKKYIKFIDKGNIFNKIYAQNGGGIDFHDEPILEEFKKMINSEAPIFGTTDDIEKITKNFIENININLVSDIDIFVGLSVGKAFFETYLIYQLLNKNCKIKKIYFFEADSKIIDIYKKYYDLIKKYFDSKNIPFEVLPYESDQNFSSWFFREIDVVNNKRKKENLQPLNVFYCGWNVRLSNESLSFSNETPQSTIDEYFGKRLDRINKFKRIYLNNTKKPQNIPNFFFVNKNQNNQFTITLSVGLVHEKLNEIYKEVDLDTFVI